MVTSAIRDFLSPLSFQDPPVITPSGWLEHGPFAAWLIDATRPGLVVELGSHWGYSFFAFCEAVKTLGLTTRCVAVDTWEGDEHAGFYSDEVFDFVTSTATAEYPTTATLVRKRFDEALADFEDGSIDLLHIDGRHRYEDAAEDFGSYLPKLSPRGVVVMHDIVVREHGFGVWRHWEDVQREYPTFEFRHGHGLGVVALGSDAPPAIKKLTSLPLESDEAVMVRKMYKQLGQAISGGDGMRRAEQCDAELREAQLRREWELDASTRQALGREVNLLTRVRRLEQDLRDAKHLTRTSFKGLLRERLRTEGIRLLGSDAPDDITIAQLGALFDAEYYAAQHPELDPGTASMEHYLRHGWPAGESPTPLFDKDWYLAVYPDVAEAGLPALHHYLVFGDAEGRDPNAVFDTSWYRSHHSELFSEGDLALVRFVTDGHRLGHDPSSAFLTNWYLERYPDVAASGRIALSDYLREGALMGRDPHPDFDTAWYVATYPDICRDGTNPLVHYLTFGLNEDRATNAEGAHHCRR